MNVRKGFTEPQELFIDRHLGPSESDIEEMLATLGVSSLEQLVKQTIPETLGVKEPISVGQPRGELSVLHESERLASENQVHRSYLGMGYYPTITPAVIKRNLLENPGWYTSYTPYQAEISQGRLEALLNFQTMVSDLTALPVSNASLLDEATAVAEAVAMAWAKHRGKRTRFLMSGDLHPQSIGVVSVRAKARGWTYLQGQSADDFRSALSDSFALVLQYPATDGWLESLAPLINEAKQAGVTVILATDLLALCLLKAPGELGADIAVGNSQRFGVPMGYGGPHAAFIACSDAFKRLLPGRIVGVSVDASGKPAYRLAMQTREQHIRREKATSNICTAQALLANVASMYAVYHGPKGLRRIADRVHRVAAVFDLGLRSIGYATGRDELRGRFFDTIAVRVDDAEALIRRGHASQINLRRLSSDRVAVSFDEAVTVTDLSDVLSVFAAEAGTKVPDVYELFEEVEQALPADFARTSAYLQHPVFNSHHSETEMLRYLRHLEGKDIALNRSMIPLGSCTMKLNATTEMMAIGHAGFAELHPYAPAEQAKGYSQLFGELQSMLAEVTGFDEVSLQPNAGSQGELAGLLSIKAYHEARGDAERNLCLIPSSAHGTNPASAVMAGFSVVVVACDEQGNIDLEDLQKKAEEHQERLGAIMVTYPSTHGVFEEGILKLCEIIHEYGGQVYLDGANFSAMVGLVRPGELGADVCHLNLHKTFAIPHGGGGPGVGPIGVKRHLIPYLPNSPLDPETRAVSAAPWGSAWVLPISWAYMKLMGGEGLKRASQIAILNANYMAASLSKHFNILYQGKEGRVAHEFIIDCRKFEDEVGISVNDIAKRLMDFGFHAPTMSWPVAGTLMVEPTESESKAEMDRFCAAMIQIGQEIQDIATGRSDANDNPLVNAPHTASMLVSDEWSHPYTRKQAGYPLEWIEHDKYWPSVARVDNAYGDRNLVCTCPPLESYE